MQVATIFCGNSSSIFYLSKRLFESLFMYGLFTDEADAERIHLHVISDGGPSSADLYNFTTSRIRHYNRIRGDRFSLHWHVEPASRRQVAGAWELRWHDCISARLALPDLLPGVKGVIYLDMDTVVMYPLLDLWGLLGGMEGRGQMIGAAWNDDDPELG